VAAGAEFDEGEGEETEAEARHSVYALNEKRLAHIAKRVYISLEFR